MARKVKIPPLPDFGDFVQYDDDVNSAYDENGNRYRLGQHNRSLGLLVDFTRLALFTQGPVFLRRMDRSGKFVHTDESKIARFFGAIHMFVEDLYSKDLFYSPDIALFFECYRVHRIRNCLLKDKQGTVHDGLTEADVYEDFVAFYRAEAKRLRIKKKLADWAKNTVENVKRIREYVDALFERYARLVFVRVEFLYKEAVVPAAEIGVTHEKLVMLAARDQLEFLKGNDEDRVPENLTRVNETQAMEDRDHFFRNLRSKPSLFAHMVGYIWSMEWTPVGGYHFHTAFIFDGSKVQKHEYLAELIGKYWAQDIKGGRGHYHNCNRNKYPDYLLGPTEYHETDKRERLLKVLCYLAKKEQFVQVKRSVKAKVFGTGKIRKRILRLGRPRRK